MSSLDRLGSAIVDLAALDPAKPLLDMLRGTVIATDPTLRVDADGRQLAPTTIAPVYVGATVWLARVGDRYVVLGEEYSDTAWHYVGAAGEPAFVSPWVNYDTNQFMGARFRRESGSVRIEGLVKNGTANGVVFTLPVGFRPTNRLVFTVEAARSVGGASRLDVLPDGGVSVVFDVSLGTGTVAFHSLNVTVGLGAA